MAAVNSLLEDALPLLIAGDRFDLLNNFPLLDAEGQSMLLLYIGGSSSYSILTHFFSRLGLFFA